MPIFKDLLLPAGLPGRATLMVLPMENTFRLPNNAMLVRQGKSLVAIVDQGEVAYINVLPGRNLSPTMEMTSAKLSERTQVIVNPNAMLKESDAVTTQPVPDIGK